MLVANTTVGCRSRYAATSTTSTSLGSPVGAYYGRSKSHIKSYSKAKALGPLYQVQPDSAIVARMRRLKAKKINGVQKMDFSKKKSVEYTEMAYREAVSKLKYLLAESYVPRSASRIHESEEDTDDRSMISDNSRTKDTVKNSRMLGRSYFSPSKSIHPSKAYSNLALSAADLQSVPPEITSFIERQEEYIEQLERESQYCRDELTNLLRKVREVVAENEALHNKSKTGFLKSALAEDSSLSEENNEHGHGDSTHINDSESKKYQDHDAPSIIFESRISELEAQLTQARLELRKAQEEKNDNSKRLSESCSDSCNLEVKTQLDATLRAKYEADLKLEDLQKALANARDKESDALQRAKRATDSMQQIEFERDQYEAEVRRLKEELSRQHEKLRDATQDANRRIAEDRQQAERRYSQQVEQLSADVASHWDTANKLQLESEKQRRELSELRRELSQKQALIDNLKKELQSKISSLQSELNQSITEKDAAEQEVLSTKLLTERNERQARQEQSRYQAEINSYKQRLERADADLVHCRRENLRLSEQIASLEKEINMNKAIHLEESRPQVPVKADNQKELKSMLMDMETKHAATVASLEGALNNQATIVSQLTAECQSLTQRLEANNRKHKEEIANLQTNIEHLKHKIEDTFEHERGLKGAESFIDSTIEHTNDEHIVGTGERENLTNVVQQNQHFSEHEQLDARDTYENGDDNDLQGAEFDGNSANINYTAETEGTENYSTDQQYDQYEHCNPLETEAMESHSQELQHENEYPTSNSYLSNANS